MVFYQCPNACTSGLSGYSGLPGMKVSGTKYRSKQWLSGGLVLMSSFYLQGHKGVKGESGEPGRQGHKVTPKSVFWDLSLWPWNASWGLNIAATFLNYLNLCVFRQFVYIQPGLCSIIHYITRE